MLRRHLATAFSALVGLQAMQEKREYGNATGHVPLTTTAKVKVRSLFKSVKYYAAYNQHYLLIPWPFCVFLAEEAGFHSIQSPQKEEA